MKEISRERDRVTGTGPEWTRKASLKKRHSSGHLEKNESVLERAQEPCDRETALLRRKGSRVHDEWGEGTQHDEV